MDADASSPAGRGRPVVGAALAVAAVAAVVVAGTTAGGRADPEPVAVSARVVALDPMTAPPVPDVTGPVVPAAALRATGVRLPTLGVDSTLVDLDVGADGVLVPPADPDVAGWCRAAPHPASRGPR